MRHLCITVRLLGGAFHGRADRGEPEWPPSPLRLFQSLVAAAAAHRNERENLQHAAPALRWLEAQPAPTIISPRGLTGAKYRLYVPDNVTDLVARSWTRGNEASIADYRSEKDVQPTHLLGGDALHYLWSFPEAPDELSAHQETLFAAVSSITHLGWGVDMAVAHAAILSEKELDALTGQHWQPSPAKRGKPLRVPVAGTLADLGRKHTAFLERTRDNRFAPVPPLSCYDVRYYADGSALPPMPTAVFSLLRPDASDFRIFDPVRDGMRVAGMLRHAASNRKIGTALGWSEEKMARTVLGHGETDGAHIPVDGPRIAFIPLPSLEARKGSAQYVVGSIRRVLLAGMKGQSQEELLDLARLLTGQMLIEEKRDRREKSETAANGSGESQPSGDGKNRDQEYPAAALLARLPNSDKVSSQYTDEAAVWSTVTPVILPGHDDPAKYRRRLSPKTANGEPALDSAQQKDLLLKLDARTESLLRKAIRQAGFSEELACNAEISWRNSGFCRGVALASEYAIPQKLRRFRRLHVRIAWRDMHGRPLRVMGPLCLGGGRFVGIGLFAPLDD